MCFDEHNNPKTNCQAHALYSHPKEKIMGRIFEAFFVKLLINQQENLHLFQNSI